MTETPQGFQLTDFSEKAWQSIQSSRSRINIWHGAVRSGKTISSLIAFGMRVGNRQKDGQYMMVGRTIGTLERNCIIPLSQIFGRDAVSYRPFQSRMRLFGRQVHLVGANDDRAADKIRGVTLTDAYGDELTTWPQSVFAMLLTRLSVTGARFYGTTNPDSPGHWLKREYLDRADELDISHWQFNLDDNLALDPTYVVALKREFTGLWYRRFVEGEWTQAEGAVYDRLSDGFEMDDDCEQMKKAKEYGERYFAIDYGTTNPFVCLDCRVYKDHLYVVSEWRWDSAAQGGKQLTNAEYADALYKFAGHPDYIRSCIVDPSATSFKLELRQEKGFSVRDGNNAVLEGVRQVSTMLGQGRIHMARTACRGTIEEMTGYRWDAKAQSGVERPVKDKDHGPDALRYIVATLGLVRRIDDEGDDAPFTVTLYDED